jgi:hypothetical protein
MAKESRPTDMSSTQARSQETEYSALEYKLEIARKEPILLPEPLSFHEDVEKLFFYTGADCAVFGKSITEMRKALWSGDPDKIRRFFKRRNVVSVSVTVGEWREEEMVCLGPLHYVLEKNPSLQGVKELISLLDRKKRGLALASLLHGTTMPLETALCNNASPSVLLHLMAWMGESLASFRLSRKGPLPTHTLSELLRACIEQRNPILLSHVLSWGADANARDKDDQPLLAVAISEDNTAAAKSLIHGERAADPNGRTAKGFPLLALAAYQGQEEIVEALLKAGANPNAEMPEGYPPLHVLPLVAKTISAYPTGFFGGRRRQTQKDVGPWIQDEIISFLLPPPKKRLCTYFGSAGRGISFFNPKDFVYFPPTARAPIPFLGDALHRTVFLRLIAQCKRELAEPMLKANPSLARQAGKMKHHSGHSFAVTAYQYALSVLDWRTYSMIRKYLTKHEAAEQAKALFTDRSYPSPLTAVPLILKLIDSLKKHISILCTTELDMMDDSKDTLVGLFSRGVGRAQRDQPFHILEELSRFNTPSHPMPDFKSKDPRPPVIDGVHDTYNPPSNHKWMYFFEMMEHAATKYFWLAGSEMKVEKSENLGEDFALYRGMESHHITAARGYENFLRKHLPHDKAAIEELLRVRVAQLLDELNSLSLPGALVRSIREDHLEAFLPEELLPKSNPFARAFCPRRY